MAERIWDRYLSEQDRAHVYAEKQDRRVGFGQRPLLLMVDLYRRVFGDRPEPLLESVKTWPGSAGLAGWQALPHIQRLLATAREAGIPITYVNDVECPPGAVNWFEAAHRDVPRVAPTTPEAIDRQRRQFDIMPEVAPVEGEVVYYKTAPSAFWGTPLVGHLMYLGIDTLIVAGESTSGCVRASVVDAASHRLRVTVVEECVFDRHEMTHAANLFDMNQKYADVLPLEEVLPYIRQLGPAKQHGRTGGKALEAATG